MYGGEWAFVMYIVCVWEGVVLNLVVWDGDLWRGGCEDCDSVMGMKSMVLTVPLDSG